MLAAAPSSMLGAFW